MKNTYFLIFIIWLLIILITISNYSENIDTSVNQTNVPTVIELNTPTLLPTTTAAPSFTPIPTSNPTLTPNPTKNLIELEWERRWRECPAATEIWLIMKDFGWSDAACAGILGNIMRECGGNTLENIDYMNFNDNKTHFGLCQWSKIHYPEIQPTKNWMPSIKEQMEFLRYTIIYYNGNGHNYGFDIDYLISATDPVEVAKIFCDGYEKPGGSSKPREQLAIVAYNYFIN